MLLHPTLDALLTSQHASYFKSKLEYHLRFRAADGRQSYRFTKAIPTLSSLPSARCGPPPTTYQVSADPERPPTMLVSLVISAALSTAKTRKIFEESTALAAEHGLEFLGIGCREPDRIHDWSATKWLSLEDAVWRLRHFADTGQVNTGALGTIVLIVAFEGDNVQLTRLAQFLAPISTKLAPPLLLARLPLPPSAATLSPVDFAEVSRFTQVQQAAAAAGARLKGLDLSSNESHW
jgi:hypothetical protein